MPQKFTENSGNQGVKLPTGSLEPKGFSEHTREAETLCDRTREACAHSSRNRRAPWAALCHCVYKQVNGWLNIKTFHKIGFKVLKNPNVPASIKEIESIVKTLSRPALGLTAHSATRLEADGASQGRRHAAPSEPTRKQPNAEKEWTSTRCFSPTWKKT